MNNAIKETPISKNKTHRGPGPDLGHSLGPGLMGACTLVGDDVCNSEGEDLGKIEEIMLDTLKGKIAYAVLSFGGFLGMGEKLFAVPWNALKIDSKNKRFLLKVSKDHLKAAPGFDKGHWPNMADQTWSKQIHEYYGIVPYWEPADTFFSSSNSDNK